jgi:transketolase C-terminal domain/subunit
VEGSSVALITSGPLLAGEAIAAAEAAAAEGVSVAVFTRPELSASLSDADREIFSRFDTVISLENFAPARAHHHGVSETLRGTHVAVLRWGIEGIPANGQPAEVLAHHGLDASSLVQLILQNRP